MKHTSGPWGTRHHIIQDGNLEKQRYDITAGEDSSIHICRLKGWDEEDDANARLIAAAPELLEACKAMVEYISQQWEDDWENRPNHLRLGEEAITTAAK